MNIIGQALAYGYTPADIVQNLLKDKKLGKKIKKALDSGFSPEEVIQNISSNSFASQTTKPKGFTSSENVQRNLQQHPSLLKRAGRDITAAAALAATGYGLMTGAPAIGAVGSYLSGQLGGGSPPSPPPVVPTPVGGGPQTPLPTPSPTIIPAQVARQAAGTPIKQTIGSLAKNILPTVAGLFGSKNKKLLLAIANIVQNTGSEVKDVYDDLASKYDISTPEKALNAAESLFKTIQTGAEKGEAEFEAKPIGEIKKELAKDLKSAVIRQTEYNPETQKLRVVFNNDSTYEYDDVPEDVFEKLHSGGIKAKTAGENQYGRWWVGKDPSLGASFNALIKKPGYSFRRGPPSPLSPEEREEYEEVAGRGKESSKQAQKLSETAEKTATATGKDKFKGKAKKQLTSEQIRNRRLLLEKQLQDIKKRPKEERNEEMIEAVNERLRSLNEIKSFTQSKKNKIINDEVLKNEKREGKNLIKKMLVLLPPSIVKVFKSKLDSMSEEEMLKMIKDFLTKK